MHAEKKVRNFPRCKAGGLLRGVLVRLAHLGVFVVTRVQIRQQRWQLWARDRLVLQPTKTCSGPNLRRRSGGAVRVCFKLPL